jgi:vacuolar-type H+-ATPase subunit I/STV1
MFDDNIMDNLDVQPEAQEQVEQQQQQQEVQKQNNLDTNMRNLREKAEREQREKEEAWKMADYYKQQLEAKNKPQEVEEVDDLGMADTDFAEGKHLNKVAKQVRDLKKQLAKNKQDQEEERQRSYMREAEIKLMAKFPDAESILTKENMDRLAQMEPAIANSIKYNPDFYERGVTAITMIKKLGIVQEEAYRADAELAKRNAYKPRASNSLSPQSGDSPIAQANAFANGLTPALKAQLLKEMDDAAKAS